MTRDFSHVPVERLREPAPKWAGDIIREQRAEIERLQDMIDNRNEFIAQRGLWRELGQYLSEPHALEPKP